MKKFCLLLICFIVFTSLSVEAQKKPFRDIHFSQHDFVDTVKIKIWDGAIIIPVEINGETKNLMFDTGANWGFWIGDEEEWMTLSAEILTITDSQNAKMKKAVYRMPPIKMGNTTIENYPLVADNALEDYVCDRMDGAFGFDLVTCGLSFKFDTKDSLMIVTDRKGFFKKEEKRQPKLKYMPYNSYYMTSPLVWVDFPWGRYKMLFDLGWIGGWIDMPEQTLNHWSKDDRKMLKEIDEHTALIDTTVSTEVGFFGRSLDTMLYRRLHFPEVKVGHLALEDLWISTNSLSVKTGSAILEHASLIIDGPKKCFFFLPREGKREIVVGNEDKKGLTHVLADTGDTLGVMKAIVRKDGEAYQKGIRSGDYLVSVNGIPITDYCTYLNLKFDTDERHYVYRSAQGEIKEIAW